MKKKLLAFAFTLLVFNAPLMAIINGRPLTNTLKELNEELQNTYMQRTESQQLFRDDYENQHKKMLDIITQANKLSILLYTQEQEMTFDLAYALKKTTSEYNNFNKNRKPYDQIVNSLNYETDRYNRLIKALKSLPPTAQAKAPEMLPEGMTYKNDTLNAQLSDSVSALEKEVINIADGNTPKGPIVLDKEGLAYRDSCIFFASKLLKIHADNLAIMVADSTHYHNVYRHVHEANNYAELRYRKLEKYVFAEGQTPFLEILRNFQYYWNKVQADLHGQYSFEDLADTATEFSEEKEGKGDGDAFFEGLSSRAENALLVIICAVQLIFLTGFWLVAYLVFKLLHRFTRVKKYISKNKTTMLSVLLGTILYFLVFGFFWKGDEYVLLSAKHINTFLWLLIAISGSLLLRVKAEQFRSGLQLYSATFLIVMVIIVCRITFAPDRLMNILFPPILFLVVLRQLYYLIKAKDKATQIDKALGWVAMAIYLIAFGFAFIGYTFVALLILVWWYFLLAAWLTILCITDLLSRYKEKWLNKRVSDMRKRITYVTGADRESLLFGATWFYDLIRSVIIPTIVLLSLPLCVRLSLGIFDFDDIYVKFYNYPFIHLTDKNGVETLRISCQSIVYLLILYYVLNYVSRAIHTIWQYVRYSTFMRKHNRTTIRVNEINLSLGNSIISALIWMAYAMIIIHVWQIPTGSMGLVAGGLSAGIGLALKDTINNFIYGIQLMGGRLRVGDWIECDGVRGRVTAINYQCVQVETIEGTETSFLNSSLFGKNFNNLTRNNSYELTTIVVGVAYGTDVKQVRNILVEAMQKMRTKDHYGREIVDPKFGVYVVVNNMSESTVDIAVKQYVLVAERIGYVDRSKEVIYDALNAAGISMAFPQCDVHLIREE